MSLSNVIITKQPSEKRLVSMDFSKKMATTETITAIVSVGQSLADGSITTDLEFSAQIISGQVVQFLVAGGNIPTRADIQECDYKVTVKVTTSLGQELENDGILKVKED